MSEPALDVVEFLLTARTYTDETTLDANDLPPRYRRVFWNEDGDVEEGPRDGIERPLVVTEAVARQATGVERPLAAVSNDTMFVDRDEFSGRLELTEPAMAVSWLLDRCDRERIATNPTLAHVVESMDDPPFDVTRDEARDQTRPIHADRVWIDALLEEYFDGEDEEDVEMLDLVQVRAPEEIEFTLDDLVLTDDQRGEIDKIITATENREFLAEIGLHEIGKLLFVGPPGTGKTTISRALAHELGYPFVEVKLSMITDKYVGETSKNVERTFEVAKRLSPCILFIDEFDSIAQTRKSGEHGSLKRAVNTLLKSIDDVSLVRDDVLLIGATNHPDQLDAAAWRRFDEIVNFPRPDEEMRADILRVITRRMEIAEFDPERVAAKTAGLTGSDLRMVMREAVLEALNEGRRTLTQTDVMAAVSDFEERDNLKNMDMIDGDADALVAGDGGHGHSHDHSDDD